MKFLIARNATSGPVATAQIGSIPMACTKPRFKEISPKNEPKSD